MLTISCKFAVLSVAKRFRSGTLIQMEDLLKSVDSYYKARGFFCPPSYDSMKRRIRESDCFEHLNKNHQLM